MRFSTAAQRNATPRHSSTPTSIVKGPPAATTPIQHSQYIFSPDISIFFFLHFSRPLRALLDGSLTLTSTATFPTDRWLDLPTAHCSLPSALHPPPSTHTHADARRSCVIKSNISPAPHHTPPNPPRPPLTLHGIAAPLVACRLPDPWPTASRLRAPLSVTPRPPDSKEKRQDKRLFTERQSSLSLANLHLVSATAVLRPRARIVSSRAPRLPKWRRLPSSATPPTPNSRCNSTSTLRPTSSQTTSALPQKEGTPSRR